MAAPKIVPMSADIARVLALPRRNWRDGIEALAARATDLLRTDKACACCGGTRGHFRVSAHLGDPNAPIHADGTRACRLKRIPLSLYPHQAAVLIEAVRNSGALVPVGVGRGKTLIGFLLVTVFESTRPLLVLQAGLIEKAKRNLAELSLYWRIPNWIKMLSYQVLGRVKGKLELVHYKPDLIICDEVHGLKSRKASVTKRVERFVMHHHTHVLPHNAIPQLAAQWVPPYHGNPLPTPADYGRAVVLDTDGTEAHEHKQCELCKDRIPPIGFGPYGLKFVGMSGTITTQSPKDFAHIAHMCLPGGAAPVPSTYVELERWHYALAVLMNPLSRYEPGALLAFCDSRDNGLDPEQAVRIGYSRRLLETPGVVGTTDDGVKASLQIDQWIPPKSDAIDDAFARLRGDEKRCSMQWDAMALASGKPTVIGDPAYSGKKLPNGYELVDGVEVYRHALELSLGLYLIWKVRPPEVWLEARRYWKKLARQTIKLGKLDSELEVANAAHSIVCTVDEMRVGDGLLPHENPLIGKAHPYDHWVAVRDGHKLETVAVWICDSILKDCTDWLHSNPRGIVWTDTIAFGRELSRVSGRPYFQNMGRDASGMYIEDATGSIIASLDSNKTGRDLQFKWDKNRFACALSDGAESQQVLARTHREGTDADCVENELLMGCVEHATAFRTARERARYIEDITQERQRLNFADVLVEEPEELQRKLGADAGASFRWYK
jgi:hypothetical protein